MAVPELSSTIGYFPVSKDEAKQLIAPHLSTDGYYLLRPTEGAAVCTICVSNQQKLMNYRLIKEPVTGLYYVRDNMKFPTIAALVNHYRHYPLNEQAKTLLLYPVDEQQGEYVAFVPSGNSDSSSKRDSNIPNGDLTDENIISLPGVHMNLSKADVPIVLHAYLGHNGSYLVRPSVSSKGQYTISLTCEDSILNFKINYDPLERKYYISPKKKCSSVKELLETHRTFPLRSKARAGAKIFLGYPITPSDVQRIKSQTPVNNALPPPWKEYYDERRKKIYYHNPQTGQTVWERPKALTQDPPPLSKPKNRTSRSFPDRPLPDLPENNPVGLSPNPQKQTNPRGPSPKEIRRESAPILKRPLPELPPKSPNPVKRDIPSLPRRDEPPQNTNRRFTPQLPPKDTSTVQSKQPYPSSKFGQKQPPSKDLPALPSKTSNNTTNIPRLPSKEQPYPPLPSKEQSCPPLPSKEQSYPPLRSKEQTYPPLPSKEKSLPPLPSKEQKYPPLPSKEQSCPPLPTKEKSLPPLPSKDYTDNLPSLPPKDFQMNTHNNQIKTRSPRPVEYEDTIVKISAATPPGTGSQTAPPPPPPPPLVSDLSTKSLSLGRAPPAPPVPPVGIPPPPPLTPDPSSFSQRRNTIDVPRVDPSSGRPFSANDLQHAKTLLKRKEFEEEQPRPKSGGLQNVLSDALDQRLGSIRNAVESDEDTDIEEVDDDDWDD